MNGLELIHANDDTWYWRMDYRHANKIGGTYLESFSYKTEIDAIYALKDLKIKWEVAVIAS